MKFAQKFRLLIADRQDISGAEIARHCGVSEASITRWKKDRNYDKHGAEVIYQPMLWQAKIIADLFGVPLEWLADDGQHYPPPAPSGRPLAGMGSGPVDLADDTDGDDKPATRKRKRLPKG